LRDGNRSTLLSYTRKIAAPATCVHGEMMRKATMLRLSSIEIRSFGYLKMCAELQSFVQIFPEWAAGINRIALLFVPLKRPAIC